MTAPGGRRSGRRVLSWVLALALLGVLGFVVFRDIGGDQPGAGGTDRRHWRDRVGEAGVLRRPAGA